ncbi:uncharacterized protein JCM10292_002654 [Rhodotorula paludigena]|uniref:uncharacterized protein n=1 Tax=Rhodotorula paludigena TaxID=86838 RepID=UPI00317DB6C0
MDERNFPAHATKHLPVLDYFLPDRTPVAISQDNAGTDSTGRTVWLGAQVLSLYLHDLLSRSRPPHGAARPRAIDLGSGTGLVALTLASLAYDTLATDLGCIVDSVLRRNVETHASKLGGARLEAHTLDWFEPPERWSWPAASEEDAAAGRAPLAPPFDLVSTADTVYDSSLIDPLLSTLLALCLPSSASRASAAPPPPIYLALERRDPALVDSFFARAAGPPFGFKCSRVEHARIKKLVEDRAGTLGWEDEEEWEGVEVWKLKLGREAVARARRERAAKE